MEYKKNRTNLEDLRTKKEDDLSYKTLPYCVIVRGSQSAIGLGTPLPQLEDPTIIEERNNLARDSWRKR